ncbi:Uncharacterized protein Adt_26573 [Abeliophyllum distichum]|uniref:Putative plant transposon protein domain-containing protein n=1 Tax=Abeliophyllum distichum TaxID=126358 RepID=A0ABD1RRA5_9LAMI
MANLINSCGWERVAGKHYLAYPLLVKEFLANLNHAIEEPEGDYRYTTWVRGKWIKFSPTVIADYCGLLANDIEPIPANLDMTQVTQFLYGRADAWPLIGPKFLHNQLTESLRIFHIFMCHNIDPTPTVRTSMNLGPSSYIILHVGTKLTWGITYSDSLLILPHSVCLVVLPCFLVSSAYFA